MADLGVEMTDKRVDEIKERLLSAYKEAASDLQKKAEEHTKKFEEKDKQKRADRDSGKLSEEDYQKWLKGQVFIGKQWQSKVDQMTRMLTNAERVAVQVVRDGQMATFADNANYTEYCIDKDTGFGVNFSLYDESTVMLLLQDQPELMPRRVVDDEKCEAWNQKVIANCITQGILQGESIPQITKRMARDTASTDMKAMVRYARTAMTGAQNSGRIYAMEKSIEQGMEVKKVWIATLDERTRDAHLDLDGQIQDVKEPFDSELGPIMYPGDPSADEANVWNCRCTLGYEYPDSPSKGQRYDQMFGEDIDDMSFDEWFEWRKGQIKEKYAFADGPKDTAKDRREGIELLRRFVEGESVDIHRLAGVNAMMGFRYDESKVDEESMRKLDSVFEPAKQEMYLYKGMPMTYEEIMSLEGKHLNHTVSSTTTDEHTANDYAEKAADQETLFPVKLNITVEEGTPIADVQELLGTEGMKAFEKEITIGRNVVWEYGEPTVRTDKYGDEYYEVNVRVYKEDDERGNGQTKENNETRAMQREQITGEVERRDDIMAITGMSEEQANEVAHALFGYKGDPEHCYFDGVDSEIRSGATPEAEEMANEIQKFIDRSPKYEGTIYRGMAVDEETLASLVPGMEFSEKRYHVSSWSSNEQVGQRYANMGQHEMGGTRVVFQYSDPVHGAPVAHLSPYPTEQEVLVNNDNARYIIVNRESYMKSDREYVKIVLEEIR